jgi:ABC-type lipoprotein export system ATPase subunit
MDMDITLHHLKPGIFTSSLSGSCLWEKELIFTQGTNVQILAPSARGKTTFLSILYGIRFDYTGEIRFDGKDSRSLTPNEWAHIRQQEFSIVFQDLKLFPSCTGYENILINAHLTGPADDDTIRLLANQLGVTSALEKKAGVLSRGEQQRVAIIRALVQPFSWLLLDEPFSHIDDENCREAVACVSSECKTRGAGLIITGLSEDTWFDYQQKVMM